MEAQIKEATDFYQPGQSLIIIAASACSARRQAKSKRLFWIDQDFKGIFLIKYCVPLICVRFQNNLYVIKPFEAHIYDNTPNNLPVLYKTNPIITNCHLQFINVFVNITFWNSNIFIFKFILINSFKIFRDI